MFIKKKSKGYVLLNSIVIMAVITIVGGVLIRVAAIRLQDSYYYDERNDLIEFDEKQEIYVGEIETTLNSNIDRREQFIQNHIEKKKEIYKHNYTVSIVMIDNKIYLKERKMSERKLKEITIEIGDEIKITPGIYKTGYEVDND